VLRTDRRPWAFDGKSFLDARMSCDATQSDLGDDRAGHCSPARAHNDAWLRRDPCAAVAAASVGGGRGQIDPQGGSDRGRLRVRPKPHYIRLSPTFNTVLARYTGPIIRSSNTPATTKRMAARHSGPRSTQFRFRPSVAGAVCEAREPSPQTAAAIADRSIDFRCRRLVG
jgi:hypothetical protein